MKPNELKVHVPFLLFQFLPRGVAFVRTEKGSVVSVFRISSLTGAEKLWQMYKDGNLEPKLQELLLNEFEAKDLTYQVNFPTERYERIHRKLKGMVLSWQVVYYALCTAHRPQCTHYDERGTHKAARDSAEFIFVD